MSKLLTALSAAGLMSAALGATAAQAAAPAPTQAVAINSQCTTDATNLKGERAACDSETQVITAPEGFVMARESFSGGLTSANGSEKECRLGWKDHAEVVPGLNQPRTVTLQAHARSPKGHATGRGWAVCQFKGHMVRIPIVH